MSNSKSKIFNNSKFKFFTFHKIGHFKKDNPKIGSKGNYVQITFVSNEGGYKNVGVLVITSLETKKIWVMDSGCSFFFWIENNLIH